MDTLINRSHEPDWRLRAWFTQAGALSIADTIIALPDICPGRSPLPTGSALITRSQAWRRFAVSDVGCGIAIVRTRLARADTELPEFRDAWDSLCARLRANRNKGLGDLGSGNHFLDAVVSLTDDSVALVVHTGSRQESGLVDGLVDQPAKFDREFHRIERWAHDNRAAVLDACSDAFGPFVPLVPGVTRLDRNHNHFEDTGSAVIIRKGVQRVRAGELALIPSNLLDEMAMVRAMGTVTALHDCLPHGTGRALSRADAKQLAHESTLGDLRRLVYIPASIDDASLRTETPGCYRGLDGCLERISDLVEVIERFQPVAYIGQL